MASSSSLVSSKYTDDLVAKWQSCHDNLLESLDEHLVLRVVQEAGAKPNAVQLAGGVVELAATAAEVAAAAEAAAEGEELELEDFFEDDDDEEGDGKEGPPKALFRVLTESKEELYAAKVLKGGAKIAFFTTVTDPIKKKQKKKVLMVMIRQQSSPRGHYEVRTSKKRVIGHVQQDPNEPVSLRRILINSADMQSIYVCETNSLKDFSVDFKVRAPNNNDRLGKVQREWTKSQLVSAGHDVYKLQFPQGSNRDIKALMIAAAVSIDQFYFDGQSIVQRAKKGAGILKTVLKIVQAFSGGGN